MRLEQILLNAKSLNPDEVQSVSLPLQPFTMRRALVISVGNYARELIQGKPAGKADSAEAESFSEHLDLLRQVYQDKVAQNAFASTLKFAFLSLDERQLVWETGDFKAQIEVEARTGLPDRTELYHAFKSMPANNNGLQLSTHISDLVYELAGSALQDGSDLGHVSLILAANLANNQTSALLWGLGRLLRQEVLIDPENLRRCKLIGIMALGSRLNPDPTASEDLSREEQLALAGLGLEELRALQEMEDWSSHKSLLPESLQNSLEALREDVLAKASKCFKCGRQCQAHASNEQFCSFCSTRFYQPETLFDRCYLLTPEKMKGTSASRQQDFSEALQNFLEINLYSDYRLFQSEHLVEENISGHPRFGLSSFGSAAKELPLRGIRNWYLNNLTFQLLNGTVLAQNPQRELDAIQDGMRQDFSEKQTWQKLAERLNIPDKPVGITIDLAHFDQWAAQPEPRFSAIPDNISIFRRLQLTLWVVAKLFLNMVTWWRNKAEYYSLPSHRLHLDRLRRPVGIWNSDHWEEQTEEYIAALRRELQNRDRDITKQANSELASQIERAHNNLRSYITAPTHTGLREAGTFLSTLAGAAQTTGRRSALLTEGLVAQPTETDLEQYRQTFVAEISKKPRVAAIFFRLGVLYILLVFFFLQPGLTSFWAKQFQQLPPDFRIVTQNYWLGCLGLLIIWMLIFAFRQYFARKNYVNFATEVYAYHYLAEISRESGRVYTRLEEHLTQLTEKLVDKPLKELQNQASALKNKLAFSGQQVRLEGLRSALAVVQPESTWLPDETRRRFLCARNYLPLPLIEAALNQASPPKLEFSQQLSGELSKAIAKTAEVEFDSLFKILISESFVEKYFLLGVQGLTDELKELAQPFVSCYTSEASGHTHLQLDYLAMGYQHREVLAPALLYTNPLLSVLGSPDPFTIIYHREIHGLGFDNLLGLSSYQRQLEALDNSQREMYFLFSEHSEVDFDFDDDGDGDGDGDGDDDSDLDDGSANDDGGDNDDDDNDGTYGSFMWMDDDEDDLDDSSDEDDDREDADEDDDLPVNNSTTNGNVQATTYSTEEPASANNGNAANQNEESKEEPTQPVNQAQAEPGQKHVDTSNSPNSSTKTKIPVQIPEKLLFGLERIQKSDWKLIPLTIPGELENFLTKHGRYKSSMTPLELWCELEDIKDNGI